MSDMGTFRIDVEVENPARPGERRRVNEVWVDTGAELSWIPADVLGALGIERYSKMRFRQASGVIVERWVGPAFIPSVQRTTDEVCSAPGDLVLSCPLTGCFDPAVDRNRPLATPVTQQHMSRCRSTVPLAGARAA